MLILIKMPLRKVKKSTGTTLLRFKKKDVEDIVVSDDEVLSRNSVDKIMENEEAKQRRREDSIESGGIEEERRQSRTTLNYDGESSGSYQTEYKYSSDQWESEFWEEEKSNKRRRSTPFYEEKEEVTSEGSFIEPRTKRKRNGNDTVTVYDIVVREDYDSNDFNIEEINNDSTQRENGNGEEDHSFDATRNFEYVKKPETSRDRIRAIFNRGFRRITPRARIIHDIYSALGVSGECRLDYEQLYKMFTGAVLIISHHCDHFHVIHDCSYSDSSCLRKFGEYIRRTGTGIGRRYSRSIVSSLEYSIEDWCNTAIYCSKRRKLCHYRHASYGIHNKH